MDSISNDQVIKNSPTVVLDSNVVLSAFFSSNTEMLEERARKGSNVNIESIIAKIPPNKPLEALDPKK